MLAIRTQSTAFEQLVHIKAFVCYFWIIFWEDMRKIIFQIGGGIRLLLGALDHLERSTFGLLEPLGTLTCEVE